jgi:diguanylate cyclase (GGDEF)-like protein/PAS domain S-box-containing protein
VAELWAIVQEFQKSRTETTQARSALSAVSSQRDQVQDLYDNAPCGYHSLDRHGRILNINQTELHWLGVTKEEAVGRRFCDFCTPEGEKTFAANFPTFLKQGHIHDLEFDLMHKNGTITPVLISATSVCDASGKFVMSRSTVFNIQERKAMELELQKLANTDTLTGLNNRRHFYELANKELARARRFKTPITLLMIDIDHFKKINDTHGHAMGDTVLQHLASTMTKALRGTDVTARLGGEEFAILLPHTSSAQASELAQRMRQEIADQSVPSPQGTGVNFTVSIGLDEWRESDVDLDALMKRCDIALYQAKNSGRNRVVQFSSDQTG